VPHTATTCSGGATNKYWAIKNWGSLKTNTQGQEANSNPTICLTATLVILYCWEVGGERGSTQPVTLLLEASLAQRALAVFWRFIIRIRIIIVDCKRKGRLSLSLLSHQHNNMEWTGLWLSY